MQRTPPAAAARSVSPKKPGSKAAEITSDYAGESNVSSRSKRPRVADSPDNLSSEETSSAEVAYGNSQLHPLDEHLLSTMRCEIESVIASQLQITLSAYFREEFTDIKNSLSLFTELKESVDFMSRSFDEMRNEFESNKETIKQLRSENDGLKKCVSDLSERVNMLEQYSRQDNIEINGIPENKSENLLHTVLQLSKVVSHDIQEQDILSYTRIRKINSQSDRPRSIVVKLRSARVRDEILVDRASSALGQKEGGGVLIAVSKKFDSLRACQWETTAEDLWVSLKLDNGKKMNICAVYLPPPVKQDKLDSFLDSVSCKEPDDNVTFRGKRPRIEDSPKNPTTTQPSPKKSCACRELRSEILEMLASWKADYDLQLSAWKTEQNKMLSTLVKDVAEIKNQCAIIRNTTTEHEAKTNTATPQLVKTSGKNTTTHGQQKYPRQYSEITQRRATTTPKASGKVTVPLAITSRATEVVDQEIPETSLRDSSKPGVIVPVAATVVDISMSDTGKDGWTEVRHRRSQRSLSNVLRGTAAPGATKLEASERWRYLHLFYVKQGTSDSQVRDHLTTICGTDVCTVEVLKSRGKYASFKLGVPSKLAAQVVAPENWAEDICVKPWRRNFRARSDETQ
ncbi:hypothetical protein PYW07_007562 [Mythimna separata]|uniref:Uncharacterized protein n=1 Tax=Mythimna separata TaxID=271217 RepID=A0AAD8E038_MYTSE|nr:hypothetical protein PYW07_007562 [Mythimna separata]